MLNKIKFSYKEADEQKNLFTKYHTLFKCMIKYNGKQYSFPYQCNIAHDEPNIDNVMYCLLLDASCYNNSRSIEDFCNELGYDFYEDIEKAKKNYKACKRTYEALNRLFTSDELDTIEDEVYDNECN